MEEITVIIGFRWFQKFRFINWLAACKTEHFGTSLARFADDSPQVLDIHVERGLVAGKCSSVTRIENYLRIWRKSDSWPWELNTRMKRGTDTALRQVENIN
jgi:hypothetical protein